MFNKMQIKCHNQIKEDPEKKGFEYSQNNLLYVLC